MKTRLLLSGIIFLTFFRVSAQSGSTPINGQNPVATSSVLRNSGPLSPQNGNATLGPTTLLTACGLNYVYTSVKLSQRVPQPGGAQPANFVISGIPSGCNPLAPPNIVQAFVYASFSGSGIPVSVTIVNPASASSTFAMSIIGQDQDKCWTYPGTYSYRADVTSAITGNGTYILSGFPTNPPTAQNDIDGATLFIIYSDPQATYTGTLDIWDGCAVGIGTTMMQTINNFNACMVGSNAKAFVMVGDLQNIPGTQFSLNGGAPFTYAFEDWWNLIEVPTTVSAGQTTADFQVIANGDCYNFEAMGLYYQTTCQACIPSATYTVTCASTASACTASNGTATATVTGGNGPFSFTWSNGDTTQTATNVGPGTYTVTITDGSGCTSIDTVVVMGVGALSFTQSQTNNLCYGDTVGSATFTATGGFPPYNYVWSPNVSTTNSAVNLSAGVYTVNVTDNYGCQNSATFTITEPPNVPIVASIAGASPICWGFSSTLTASATGGAPPYTYTWISPAGTNPVITVNPTVTTTYSVIVADACFTIHDTATFTLVVNQLPVISFNGDVLSDCAPLCVDFTSASNPASSSCYWTFGDNPTSSATNPSHCFNSTGQYTVELHVTDVNGCIDSVTYVNYIYAYPNPIAGFTVTSENPATLNEPTVMIDDISTGGDTCYWDFGDGNMLTVVGCGDVSNQYQDTGAYHVTEIVVNNFGCSDTVEYDVYIIPYTTIYVPNSFTPNGNGNNDVFYAFGEFVDDFHMMIFDRWGNQIFESYDQLKGWDGKANGGKYLAQEDTYVWVITYTEQHSHAPHKIIGHVNLIR